MWGDCDPFFPVAQAERTAQLIQGASLTVLPGAGHFLPEERPAELVDVVEALSLDIETARRRRCPPRPRACRA